MSIELLWKINWAIKQFQRLCGGLKFDLIIFDSINIKVEASWVGAGVGGGGVWESIDHTRTVNTIYSRPSLWMKIQQRDPLRITGMRCIIMYYSSRTSTGSISKVDAVHCNWHSQNRNKLPLSVLRYFPFSEVDAFICADSWTSMCTYSRALG